MTLEELGRSIREKREAADLSIDDVAARIKVSTRILRTIEEGSLVGLPHAVYTKSFIRSFGQIVGYDPQELNAALEELFPPDAFDENRSEQMLRVNPPLAYPDAGKRFVAMVCFLVLIAGIIGGIWFVSVNYGSQIIDVVKSPFSAITSNGEGQEQQPPAASDTPGNRSGLSTPFSTLAAQSALTQEEASDAQRPAPPGAMQGLPEHNATNNSPASAGVGASEPGKDIKAPVAQAADAEESGASSDMDAVQQAETGPNAGAVIQPRADDKNSLEVRANAKCWIRARADGGRAQEFTLSAGNSSTFIYSQTLEITFGNAGGVTLAHNGKDLGVPGGQGQIVVLRFPRQ